MRAIVCALTLAAAIALAAPANADPEGDYLNILSGQPGYIGGPINNGVYLNTGHRACDLLHGGTSYEDTVSQLVAPPYISAYTARISTDAAQTALCPDTKR